MVHFTTLDIDGHPSKIGQGGGLLQGMFGLSGVGSSSIRTHRVVKHKVIPSYSCESVGAALEPAHTFHKVLVLPISKSTEEEHMISIFNFCNCTAD